MSSWKEMEHGEASITARRGVEHRQVGLQVR
jgi:hypothetical protein